MNTGDFQRILKERASSCDFDEFEALLAKYGHDDACLDAIGKGVSERLRREDSGDWTSPASSGWAPTMKKKKRLEQHILDRGPAGMFNHAAAQPATPVRNDEAVAQLQQQVRQLQARVTQLEKLNNAAKFKL